MAQLHTRTLQTAPEQWNSTAHPQPDLIVVSLGGNDFNHQNGNVPTNSSFSSAYARLLDQLFLQYERSEGLVVASVCGMVRLSTLTHSTSVVSNQRKTVDQSARYCWPL
eukprot:COSAG06_NODE_690_length_13054_cov_5.226476_17_plen_109_part_00